MSRRLPTFVRRSRILRVLGVDWRTWARRYDLAPFTTPCVNCGAQRVTDVPFAIGDQRGLIADACPCGTTDAPYCVVRVKS